jgi:hypothetical protein
MISSEAGCALVSEMAICRFVKRNCKLRFATWKSQMSLLVLLRLSELLVEHVKVIRGVVLVDAVEVYIS